MDQPQFPLASGESEGEGQRESDDTLGTAVDDGVSIMLGATRLSTGALSRFALIHCFVGSTHYFR